MNDLPSSCNTEIHKRDTKNHRENLCEAWCLLRNSSRYSLKQIFLLSCAILISSQSVSAQSDFVDPEIGGYFKELGQLSVNNDFSEIRYDNFLQNRLETQWEFSEQFEFNADLRTRLLSGYSIRNTPNVVSLYETDSNYFDLSWVLFDTDNTLLQSQIDRLYGSYFSGDFELHAGRQRINWGRTFVWNPNDLFNNYAFLNFDYEERPGVDALNAQYSWSYASSVQAAFRLADSWDESVLAGMVRTTWGSYDIQITGGHYLDNLTLGAGWAGYVRDAGFKGEISYFHPEAQFFNETGHFTATTGIDYMLPSGLYLRSELLYNGGYNRRGNPLNTLVQPPSADNLFIAKSGFYLGGSYQIHPLLSGNLGFLGSFDRSVFVVIPQVTYSVTENLDLLLLSQLLKGQAFNQSIDTPNLFFFRLKWSY